MTYLKKLAQIAKAILWLKPSFLFLVLGSSTLVVAQTPDLRNNPEIEQLIANCFDWNENEQKPFTALTETQKEDLFLKMIESSETDKEAYFTLFNWYLNHWPGLNKLKWSPMEYSLMSGRAVPLQLLIDHYGKIPEKVVVQYGCNTKQVSSLCIASEMENMYLLNEMLSYGLKPDSMAYDFWFRQTYNPKSCLFFSKWSDTTIYSEEGNILDYIFKGWNNDFAMDIPVIYRNQQTTDKLLEAILQRNIIDIKPVFDAFIDFHLKYLANKSSYDAYSDEPVNEFDSEYHSNTFDIIFNYAFFSNNITVLNGLYKYIPNTISNYVINDCGFGYRSKELQDWITQKGILDRIDESSLGNLSPFYCVKLIGNGIKADDSKIDTRFFLTIGGTVDDLQKFYAADQTHTPEIFSLLLKGDLVAVDHYLSKNGNPFITDKYGLTLFELMAYLGMEKQVVTIANENKYLPLEHKSITLALLGHNPKIMEVLSEKVQMEDFAGSIYDRAILNNDMQVVTWLVEHNYSAEKCATNEDYAEITTCLFSNTKMLNLLLKAGLTNHKISDDYPAFVFATRYSWDDDFSLLELAIANHFDEAAKMMIKQFYPGDTVPEIGNLILAAYTGTAEITNFLLDRGLDANTCDTQFYNIVPIELAAAIGNSEALKAMVSHGANIHQIPNRILSSGLCSRNEILSLIDISGSLSVYSFLEKQGLVLSSVLIDEIAIDIDCHKNERAKELIMSNDSLPYNDIFTHVFYAGNSVIGEWMLRNFNINVIDYIDLAISYDSEWFFKVCSGQPELAEELLAYRDEDGNTLLHIAINKDQYGLTKLLLQNGFDANIQNNKGYSAYYELSENQYIENRDELIQLMNQQGATLNLDTKAINSAFIDAINSNQLDNVIKYLDLGADPNLLVPIEMGYWNSSYDTLPVIYDAILNSNETLAQILLLYGANPNVPSEDYERPLLLALDKSLYNAARMLIYMGADVSYIPKMTDNYTCEKQEPLSERIKKINTYDDEIFLSTAQITDIEDQLDTLALKAVRENNIKGIDRVFDKIEQENYWCDQALFQETLLKEAKPDFFKYVFDKNYANIKDDTLALINEMLQKQRYDLFILLPDDYLPTFDFTTDIYNDPISTILYDVGRFPNLDDIFIAMNDKPVRRDTSAQARKEALQAIKLLIQKGKGFDEAKYINQIISSRDYDVLAWFLHDQSKVNNERQSFLAILNFDTKTLAALLDQGVSVNARLYEYPLITIAAWAQNTIAFRLLLDKGANVEVSALGEIDYNYRNMLRPVVWSVIYGDKEAIDLLNKKGANFKSLDIGDQYYYGESAYTLLMAQPDKRDVFEYLLKQKLINNTEGNNSQTLLTQAINLDDTVLVKLLLNYPASPVFYQQYDDWFYAPKNKLECINYAIQNSAEHVFFSLVNDVPISSIKNNNYNLQECRSTKILLWIINNNFTIDYDTYFNLLGELLRSADNQLFYDVFNHFGQGKSNPLFTVLDWQDPFMEWVFEEDNLEVLKFLFDSGLTYKDDMLKKALQYGDVDYIDFLSEKGEINWIDEEYYQKYLLPDFSKNYETWKHIMNILTDEIAQKKAERNN